jgi:hypothetical protein
MFVKFSLKKRTFGSHVRMIKYMTDFFLKKEEKPNTSLMEGNRPTINAFKLTDT